jgi:Cytochrome C oxidase, cbb3-type, subunit III
MDFPLFHLDFMGNRMLIAVIAIVHVLINHALAVGFIPLVTLLEYRGYKLAKLNIENSKKWDDLAYKIMKTGFIITTSIGALTGVGIWFSASLINPASIASLIRIFYMAWFVEWVIFVLEVVFIMIYFLTWKKANLNENAKRKHILFGTFLALFSWLTMVIIVAILSFMMDPGDWINKPSFFNGVFNPIYFPQLMFRTPVAMIMGGTFILFLARIYLKKTNEIYSKAIRFISFWILFWSPYALFGAYLYYIKIPTFMIGNLPIAVGTQAFQEWYGTLIYIIIIAISAALIISLLGILKPKTLPKYILVLPLIFIFFFMGTFERIREFIRKPYVINEYMYSNAFIKSDYPLFQKDGILPHATYSSIKEITENNKIQAGKEVFVLTCSRCHTTQGINSALEKFENMYGKENLESNNLSSYIKNMHNARVYMPPFPGNQSEIDALSEYIISLQKYPNPIEGAQSAGTKIN